MFRRALLSLLFVCISLFTYAQIGTQFWFAVPYATPQHADRPIFLKLSSYNDATTINISIPAQNITIATISLAPNSFQSIDITDQLDQLYCFPFDQIQNKGLLIESAEEISVYYDFLGISHYNKNTPILNQQIVNTDIFSLKALNALGTNFYLPLPTAWNNRPDTGGYSAFQIVASEDNTQVTIVPTKNLDQHPANIPYTITLNRGQTYSARSLSMIGTEKPTGTHITSTKPIAVTIIDDTILDGANWDTAGDQIIPVPLAGKEYIAVNISGALNQDVVTITATQDNTDITVNGSKLATISKGTSYQYRITTDYAYIQTSLPTMVFHVGGFGSADGVELGGALLPPLGCTGSRKVQLARDNDETFKLSVVTTIDGIGSFTINGNSSLLTSSDFIQVGTTQWYYALKTYDVTTIVPQTSYSIDNPKADFHVGILNGGTTTGFRYGYFSDYGGLNLGPDKTLCLGTAVKLNAGFGKDTYLWSDGSKGQYLAVSDSGTYFVNATKGACPFSDTIHIGYYPKNTDQVIISPKADTTVCEGTTVLIKGNPVFKSFTWQNNSTAANFEAKTAAPYILTVVDVNGCSKKDTINIKHNPLPIVKIRYQGDLNSFCNAENVTLEATGNAASYTWLTQGSSTSIQIMPEPLNKFVLTGQNAYNCFNKDSVSFDCSDFIFIPNVFTPNGDKTNEKFLISNKFLLNTWNLDVYNRWGKKVYSAHPYNNEWDGDDLDAGVYYYSLEKRDSNNNHKGWVEIIR